jgi:hypothetical protein
VSREQIAFVAFSANISSQKKGESRCLLNTTTRPNYHYDFYTSCLQSNA